MICCCGERVEVFGVLEVGLEVGMVREKRIVWGGLY